MWDVRVCAACLATDVRMYSMSAASLLEPYRLLTGIELEGEGMPQKLCWECATLVHKFNMFRHKCERAGLLLQEIYKQHDEVSEQDVLRVNREQHKLISSYTVCPIQVYNLSSLKTKIKKSHKGKTSEAEKTKVSQTGDAQKESFVKLEIEIIKKEEVPIEMKSEVDETERIDDVFVEEDCSQAVKLEALQTIKRVRKSRQGLKQTEKKQLKARDVFTEEGCLQAVQQESPQKIKRVRQRRQRPKPKKKKQLKAIDFGMNAESLSQEQQMEVMREKQNTKVYKSAPFPCTLCYIHFNEEKAFENHMLKHDPVSGELICDICKLRFKKRHSLRGHIQGLHMKRYSCRSCPSVFYNRHTARKHYAWHKGVVYTCSICGASYNKNTTYQSHLRNKHSSEHVCDQCGEPFHSKKGLRQHINMAHKIKRDTVASGVEHETSGTYCAECDIQFTCKQAWTRHILISPKHEHERHMCYLGCYICGETLPDKQSLRAHRVIHRRTHRYTKFIKCEQCGEAMESHRAYDEHFRRAHPDETRKPCPIRKQRNYPANAPCMCELCGKVYNSRMALTQHSYKHTGRRPFKCDTCSKTFLSRPALKLHVRTHTKELPYKCDICGRGFASPFNFERHKKIVHTDVRPYACDICSKRFKCRMTVKAHIECVHLQKPWPKRDRSKRQNGSSSLEMKALATFCPQMSTEGYNVQSQSYSSESKG